jgi:hypothetical protein
MKSEQLQATGGSIVRLAKYASIIFVLAAICGGICALYDYYMQFRGDDQKRESATRVESDTPSAAKQRFIFGGAIGTLVGAAYVGRCIARKEEP